MKIVTEISISELLQMAEGMYGSLVKADVDIAKGIIIVDMEMHADGEAELLKHGSKQEDLWGINLYPDKFGSAGFVEFDSMINLKPRQQNLKRGIDDPSVREKILSIVKEAVHD